MTLSQAQVALIKTSWGKLKSVGSKELGLLIFQRLLNQEPQVRGVFLNMGVPMGENEISLEYVRNHPKLLSHASKIGSAVASFANKFENPEELEALTTRLGKAHANSNVELQHFESMGPVILSVVGDQLELPTSSPVIEAWAEGYGVLKAGILKAMVAHTSNGS
ncbi:unnamed protein product [Clavelina lepadiformis]|uniref:Globin domain-containing protein n=1 Tax=Clavelina lepadiformis TaxID=159417 RepID=A0ABP0FTQ3_CLALP